MEEVVKNADLVPIMYKCILIFGIAGLIVPLFNRIHVSPVLGFLISGVILSPNLVQPLIENTSFLKQDFFMDLKDVELLGQLGVLGLLFMIGLELSFKKLAELKHYIFGLGSLQILVTGAIIMGIASLFGNTLQSSIIIGAGFALSSTAIIMQLLTDHNMKQRSIGRSSFSILLMQDLAIIPILMMIGFFAAENNSSSSTPLLIIYSIASSVAIAILVYFIGMKLLQPTLHKVIGTNKNEWIASFSLFVLCLICLIMEKIGLSMALGAFLAGILIAETEFREKIENILYPLKSILLGLFFISIGMAVDIFQILQAPLLLAISIIGIFVVKGSILYPLCRLFKIKHPYARDISIMLCQPGEFTLMVISLSMAKGLIPANDAQFFLLVTVLGMLVTPLVFKFIPTVKGHNTSS